MSKSSVHWPSRVQGDLSQYRDARNSGYLQRHRDDSLYEGQLYSGLTATPPAVLEDGEDRVVAEFCAGFHGCSVQLK